MKNEIQYLKYHSADILSLKDLWLELINYHAFVAATFKNRFINVNFNEHYCSLLKNEELFAYVAILNNQIIGFIIALRNSNCAELDSIYILPQYRNKGIGDKLIKKALDELTRKCTEIIIKVAEGNEQPFHSKNHFKKRYTVFQYDYNDP